MIDMKKIAWILYDFGNSAYALIVMTIFFPLFFAEFVAPGESAAALWGISVAISILVVGLLSPFLGAYADKRTNRKGFFVFFSSLAILGTIILPWSAYGPKYSGIIIFILVNSAFGMSLFLYDSFILVISKDNKVSTSLSGLGWAMGYIGGPLCLGIAYLLMGRKFPSIISEYQTLFLITGIFFFVSAILPFRILPKDAEPPNHFEVSPFKTVWNTLTSWRKYKHIFVFLLAMYFIMNGLTTIVYFISLFANQVLKFTIDQIVILLLITQIVGIFSTVIMGWLAEKYGEIRLLICCSIVWCVLIILIYFNTEYNFYFYIAALTGTVVGSTPAIARGFLGKIIPFDKRAELFGFNSSASRISALMGPLIFGIVTSLWNMKLALLTVIPAFMIGIILLLILNKNFDVWINESK